MECLTQNELEEEVKNYRTSPINIKPSPAKNKNSLAPMVAAVFFGLLGGYFAPFSLFGWLLHPLYSVMIRNSTYLWGTKSQT